MSNLSHLSFEFSSDDLHPFIKKRMLDDSTVIGHTTTTLSIIFGILMSFYSHIFCSLSKDKIGSVFKRDVPKEEDVIVDILNYSLALGIFAGLG
jgi:uncharacterized membrane-anchored protein YitT (DUF2179 family)